MLFAKKLNLHIKLFTLSYRDLHALRAASLLYHELAVHDRDLHALRAASLLYHEA